jgi:glyoxylase-like metal-dependent hydrolase (beta-lactamase superfamily II)
MPIAAPVIRMGEITITILDSGLLLFDMGAEMGLPESAWRPMYAEYFEQPLRVPVQHVLVQTPATTLLVDAGSSDFPEEEAALRVPDYTPPPSIPDQLRALGVPPEQVQQIVVTHLHFDHYNGLSETRGGRTHLCFPNAEVYVGVEDWADPQRQAAVQQPGAQEYRTLGEVARQGRLRTVEAGMPLAPGLEIVRMPGETPGHLGVRVAGGDQVLYAIGDLVHHIVEVEQPEWHVPWADHASIMASREDFLVRVRAEAPLIVASHIPGVGRMVETPAGWRWQEVAF